MPPLSVELILQRIFVREAIESKRRGVLRGEDCDQCGGSPAIGIKARSSSELHRVSSLPSAAATTLVG
jgi:hypothetical protein